MEINIEAMLREQAKAMEKINALPIEREVYPEVCHHGVKVAVSKTNMLHYRGEVLLVRYINNKVVRVRFSPEVQAKDLEAYFSLEDGMFLRCSRS
jgi:hypothetical protein